MRIFTAALACAAFATASSPAFAQDEEPDWGYYAKRTCEYVGETWGIEYGYDPEVVYWQNQDAKNIGQCIKAHVAYFKENGEDSIPWFAY